MRIDWYAKGVLTAIAVLLAVIALRPYVHPDAVQAQGSFAGVQFAKGPNTDYYFFDSRTGDLWTYKNGLNYETTARRLTKFGQPLK